MFEIQEAAKIITESVDSNAKIIFGTVRDDKLKKGEIKITVIASGFPENSLKKSVFQSVDKEEKGKIYNSIPTSIKESSEEKKIVVEEDDDWGAIPAFLRRKK
jgi:cell division GTPase FtsZ